MPAPFWEDDYSDDSAEPFGTAAGEVVDLGRRLGGGIALDAGCGDGRNALALASAGLQVDAFDLSGAGIAKLKRRAAAAGLTINATVDDLRDFEPARAYDLVVCHGVLHFLQPADASRALIRLQAATRPGGWNVVTVFTTRVPVPADLLKLTPGVFAEGDLVARYRGWAVERAEAYVFQDEGTAPHPLRGEGPREKDISTRQEPGHLYLALTWVSARFRLRFAPKVRCPVLAPKRQQSAGQRVDEP